tara:strand:+ start:794 stop:1006 length:213 start_codon:yes stop_codon:yes gene_type:complete
MFNLQKQMKIMNELHNEARKHGELAAYKEIQEMFASLDTSSLNTIMEDLKKIMQKSHERFEELQKAVKFK